MAFSLRAGTNWCHDFPKLARESGFHFNMHRRKVRVDWNRISSIDVDRVLAERDFSTIDDNVNNVVDYCLESEYDVKILDPNFVKLFRLAQLAVEYLLYCKQYLDHSVVILKEELEAKIDENSTLKNELESRERVVKELRDKLKERSRIIETKLSDSHGEIHKCPQCPKTFVSALFMSAHVTRRHPNASSTSSSSPMHERYRAETEKLHSEIKSLKERLNLTERVVRNESEKFFTSDSVVSSDNRDVKCGEKSDSRCHRDEIIEEQHRRYQEEIGQLKASLFDEIRNLKYGEKNSRPKSASEDYNNAATEELIRRQENEIKLLRQRLDKKEATDTERMEARSEQQRKLWQSKMDELESRYRADMEKLYAQLRATQESANGMRMDYLTRISELERREASVESSLMRARSRGGNEENSLSSPREVRRAKSSESRVRRGENPSRIEEAREVREEEEKSSDGRSDRGKTAENSLDARKIRRELSRKSSSTPKALRTVGREREPSAKASTRSGDEAKREKFDRSRPEKWAGSSLKNGRDRDRSSLNFDVSRGKSVNLGRRISAKGNISIERAGKFDNVERKKSAFNVSSNEKFFIAEKNRENAIERAFINDEENSDTLSEDEESESWLGSESLDDSSRTEEDGEGTRSNEIERSNNSEDRRYEIEKFDKRERIKTRQEALEAFRAKLRELGVDPEWRGIPDATFAQLSEIVRHHRNINSKKYRKFDEIRRKIVHQLTRRLARKDKERGNEVSNGQTSLERLVTNVKSKVSRALNILDKNDGYRNNRRASVTGKSQRRESNEEANKSIVDRSRAFKSRSMISEGVGRKTSFPRGSLTSEDSYGNPPGVSGRADKRRVDDEARGKNDPPPHLSHSYESIRDFISDTKARREAPENVVTSDRRSSEKMAEIKRDVLEKRNYELSDDFENFPRNNSAKSVLKTSLLVGAGSLGSLTKKRVFFDLETPERSARIERRSSVEKNTSESDFDISSIGDVKVEAERPKDDSPESVRVVTLRTSQSEKIAKISQQIEQQLSVARRKPAGAVEAMFLDKFALESAEPEVQERRGFFDEGKLEVRAKETNLEMEIDELLKME